MADNSEKIRLELNDILEYQANRPPYPMMDCAEEVIPGKSAKGYKNLTATEWFFSCHFPGDPNMPGMMQIEALVQMSALAIVTLPGNKGRICYLFSANKLLFKRKVLPGDRLYMETEIISFKRGIIRAKGVGTVNGELTCQAEYGLVVPEIIEEFRIKR